MTTQRFGRVRAIALLAIAVVGACAGPPPDEDGGPAEDVSRSEAATSFGSPGAVDEADRTIEVRALDDLSFDPADVAVDAGETIRFVVTNEGDAPHELVIGDAAYQEEHEEAMEHAGGHSSVTGNAISLEPGEVSEIVWTFSEPGEVLYACHVEGHYEGGMVGTVTVEA